MRPMHLAAAMLRRHVWRVGIVPGALALLGCAPRSPTPSSDAPSESAAVAPTYHRDIAPILRARCEPCHHRDGIGEVPLATYDEARANAALLGSAIRARRMPPFPPDDRNCEPLEDPRKMTDDERATFASWLAAGTPEGDPAEAPPPEPPKPDVLGPPTDIYDSGFDYRPPANAEEYRCFVIDPKLDAYTWMRAISIGASHPRTVHHAIVYVALPEHLGAVEKLDADDPAPGYPCYGGAKFDGAIGVGGYAPGSLPLPYAGGSALVLPPGTRFVVEVHYHALYQRIDNRLSVHAWRADGPPSRVARGVQAQDLSFVIPAGAKSTVATPEGRFLPKGATSADPAEAVEGLAWGVGIHMHLLGKTGRVDLVRRDGTTQCLLDIPRWNDDWQGDYRFKNPVRVEAGDRMVLRCEWDNSPEHQPTVNGKKQTPREVRWGFNVLDEMCNGALQLTDE